MRSVLYLVAVAGLFTASTSSFAQAPAASPAPAMDKAALSKSCSQQADSKGLHGKARKHFRSQCKHGH